MSGESQHTQFEDKIQEQVRLWGFPTTCTSLYLSETIHIDNIVQPISPSNISNKSYDEDDFSGNCPPQAMWIWRSVLFILGVKETKQGSSSCSKFYNYLFDIHILACIWSSQWFGTKVCLNFTLPAVFTSSMKIIPVCAAKKLTSAKIPTWKRNSNIFTKGAKLHSFHEK